MFPFKKPPSRAEVARETVAKAASGALDSLSHHAHDLIENAHDFIEGTLESAHDKLEIVGAKIEGLGENASESSPVTKTKTAAADAATSGASAVAGAVSGTAEKLGAIGAGAATGVAVAGKSVADKVSNLTAARETSPPQPNVPDVKRARKQAQSEIKDMNKKAVKYKRELEQELARDREIFAAEQARMEREYEQLQADLEEARAQAADERDALSKRQRKYDDKHDITRVPIAPTDEVVAIDSDDDGDYEYSDPEYGDSGYQPKSGGGGNAWLLLGGALLVGAGAVYYLFSSTDGKRKRAAIQDRVGQVADSVREKATQASDETGEANVEEIAEAATEAFDRSNEKILDEEVIVSGIDAKLPPTTKDAANKTGLPDKAAEKIEEVSDKVADGIAGAGAFLADKLEAAGAGAKSAAGLAAEKLDETKEKTVAKIDAARKPAPTQAPDAVVVEVITDELPHGETTEEILAEVEQTVRNIEDSVREEKKP